MDKFPVVNSRMKFAEDAFGESQMKLNKTVVYNLYVSSKQFVRKTSMLGIGNEPIYSLQLGTKESAFKSMWLTLFCAHNDCSH